MNFITWWFISCHDLSLVITLEMKSKLGMKNDVQGALKDKKKYLNVAVPGYGGPSVTRPYHYVAPSGWGGGLSLKF